MYYVICPECKGQLEIPPEAVGSDRTDPWNIAYCYECNTSFDYDDEEVITDDREDPLFF